MADNCAPRKIDSNSTGLRFAETICGRLPNLSDDGVLPTWYELEPNSYSDFGGDVTTTVRAPISEGRQNKKGTPVDFDASAGFNQDFTQTNFTRILQGFFFADAREKPNTAPMNGEAVDIATVVAASDTFTSAEGMSRFRVGALVQASGFTAAANNGIHRITAVTDLAITVATALVDEATPPADARLEIVGAQLANAGASMVMVGALGQLTLAATPVAATGTVTVAVGGADEDDTVTVGGVIYTYKAVPAEPYEVLIGADATADGANLAAAINGNVFGTPAHPRVTALNAAGVVTITASIPGTSSNTISLVEDGANITVSGALMTGGTGMSFPELGLIEGEWIYLGADVLANRFANNVGYGRIGAMTNQTILFDKTTWVPQTEAGTGKDIQIYIGTVVKNEDTAELITTRYLEFGRTLGKDADGVQSQYLNKSVANELTLNIPLAEKLNADLTFVSGEEETRTGVEGVKAGPLVKAPGEDAYNTSSHIIRMRMAVIDPATSRPSPLFAYITEGNLAINNNVTPLKVIGTFGAIDVNVGNFDVGGELTAVFSTVLAVRAIRASADVTCDFIVAARNTGFIWDIPLLTLSGGALNIEAGEPVTIPLTLNGAENPNGYTMLYNQFNYLPTIAMPVQGAEY